MKSHFISLFVLWAFGGMHMLSLSASSQNDVPERLNKMVQVHESHGSSLSALFTDILSSAHLPGGVVTVPDCVSPDETKFSISALTTRVQDALNSITAMDKRYRWEMQGGAANLLPASGEPEFLKTKIQDFKIDESRTTVLFASGILLQNSDVQRAAAQLGLKKDDLEIYVGGVTPGTEIRLHLQNVTVREALNAIANAHGHGIWRYSESHCNGKRVFTITWIVS
ncbi:MAG TPA: hypothetical protein VNW97_20180 [Candidatus Saccharimonadales bacterium]|jgi:hypothetical protein|nr:hypothetical protein [Candidatus Saccharimonadales bacterium]